MPLFYAEKSFLHCAAVCNGDLHSVIIFWDIEKGIEKKRLLAHGRGILITDRYHVARVSSDDTLVKVFDLETEKVIELKGHTSRVEKACASGDGKYLAIGGRNTQVKVWNLPDGTERFNANVLGSGFYRMKFVQEGATLAVANIRTVFLDAGSGKIIEKSPAPFGATDVSPNGKMMVYKGEVRIFNEKEGKFTKYPDAINIYSRAKNDVIASFRVDANLRLHHLLFSPNAERLIAVGSYGELRVWNISTLKP